MPSLENKRAEKYDGAEAAHVKVAGRFAALPTSARRDTHREASGDLKGFYHTDMKCQLSKLSCICFLSSRMPHPPTVCSDNCKARQTNTSPP